VLALTFELLFPRGDQQQLRQQQQLRHLGELEKRQFMEKKLEKQSKPHFKEYLM